jgi:hypothetical protein
MDGAARISNIETVRFDPFAVARGHIRRLYPFACPLGIDLLNFELLSLLLFLGAFSRSSFHLIFPCLLEVF